VSSAAIISFDLYIVRVQSIAHELGADFGARLFARISFGCDYLPVVRQTFELTASLPTIFFTHK